jgi:hypothetical protein
MTTTKRLPVFFALLALLAITRVGHFGSAVSLPDASLAVFLLGGLWLGGVRCFAAYMLTAFGIDVFLAKTAIEAGWCLTPAYAGLVLSYGVMWLAGRYLAKTPELPALRLAPVAVLAVLLAFGVSNLSFWAFSGYFGGMPASTYAARVIQYLPPYLGSTALYLGLAWAGWRLTRIMRRTSIA